MSKHITRYAVAAALLAGCYQDDASVAAPQAVRPQITVRLTDAPFPYDSLHSVYIYVVRIEANTAADTSGGGQWALITEPRKTFDLLALQQGATAVLGQGEMPAGQYHAVRMTIDTLQSSITWNDAAQQAAHVNWHGWKTIYAFVEYPVEVAAQGADIVLDFDIGRSFLFNYYGNYEFDFTPQLRAINSAAAGAIAGTVTQDSGGTTSPVPNAQISVFATYPAQPDSIGYLEATGRSDSTGHYTVGFLPPGRYFVKIEEPFMPWLAGGARHAVARGGRQRDRAGHGRAHDTPRGTAPPGRRRPRLHPYQRADAGRCGRDDLPLGVRRRCQRESRVHPAGHVDEQRPERGDRHGSRRHGRGPGHRPASRDRAHPRHERRLDRLAHRPRRGVGVGGHGDHRARPRDAGRRGQRRFPRRRCPRLDGPRPPRRSVLVQLRHHGRVSVPLRLVQ